jgi:excinuclease ABC subunit C
MNSPDIGKEVIKKEIPLVPKLPGIYKMLDSNNEVLYVGKAKNLTNRLKSYISEKNHIIRTERMLSQTKKLEITTTLNESEALLLEANLIKKYKPKFNILLKDDKSFPYIFFSSHEFPRIQKHRGAKNNAGKYYGPFASSLAVSSAIKTLQRIFLLRSCTDKQVEAGNKTCFNYLLKRCSGPCG